MLIFMLTLYSNYPSPNNTCFSKQKSAEQQFVPVNKIYMLSIWFCNYRRTNIRSKTTHGVIKCKLFSNHI